MGKKIIFCVLLLVSSKCDSHQPGHTPSLLGGLLSGAHDLGTKVHSVLGGLAQGALNVEGHFDINRVQTGYQHQPRPPPPPNHGYRPDKPTETIVVVVETEGHSHHHHDHHRPDHEHHYPGHDHHYPDHDHHRPDQDHHHHDYYPDNGHHHGHDYHGGHRPPPPGNRPQHHHDPPNYPNRPGYGSSNGQWNDNNNNKPQNNRPGYGYNPQGQQNFDGNTYTNNGNYDQNNYGKPQNNNNNYFYGSKPPSYGNGNFNKYYGSNEPSDTGNNNNSPKPDENIDQNYGTKPEFNNGNNAEQNHNIPNNPPPFLPQDGFQDQNKPAPQFTNNQPEKNTQYGSIYDVNKENSNNIPTRKPELNVNNDHTTKQPDDDIPLFVPLNPGQYHYGGDNIEVSAPKRETNPSPAEEEDNESYPIDVRFGDQ